MALSNFQRHVDKISSGSASRGPSAVAERLVTNIRLCFTLCVKKTLPRNC